MSMDNNHVKVNALHPQAQACCDRCGFLYNHVDLSWQHEWAGETIINLQLLVCPTCLDELNENLRTYNPGPDPIPIKNPRFETADME